LKFLEAKLQDVQADQAKEIQDRIDKYKKAAQKLQGKSHGSILKHTLIYLHM